MPMYVSSARCRIAARIRWMALIWLPPLSLPAPVLSTRRWYHEADASEWEVQARGTDKFVHKFSLGLGMPEAVKLRAMVPSGS